MAEKALTQPATSLRRAARRLRERLCPTPLEERFENASTERRVAFEAADDGMAWLHLYLPVVEARMILDRADRIALEQQQLEKEATTVGAAAVTAEAAPTGSAEATLAGAAESASASGDTDGTGDEIAVCRPELTRRTLQQLRVDVMRDLLLENTPANLATDTAMAGAAGGRSRASVRITIPALSLLGLSEEPATLDGYGPIDLATARRIAAGAPSFQRVITDPITGTVLDIDRRAHNAPADLKRWLELRDETCRFPGCNTPVSRCELDHTIAWATGGPTAHDNLAHLCTKHHHLKHETAWQLTQLPAGVLRWVSPLGRIHYTHPATHMRAPGPPPRPSIPPDFWLKSATAAVPENDPPPY